MRNLKGMFFLAALSATVFAYSHDDQSHRQPNPVSYANDNEMQNQANQMNNSPHSNQQAPRCPSGCGCVAPCHCGCMEGYPCNCPASRKK